MHRQADRAPASFAPAAWASRAAWLGFAKGTRGPRDDTLSVLPRTIEPGAENDAGDGEEGADLRLAQHGEHRARTGSTEPPTHAEGKRAHDEAAPERLGAKLDGSSVGQAFGVV